MAVKLFVALCALLLAFGCACAEENAAYLSSGGFIAQAQNDDLYIADASGILRVSENNAIRITEGTAANLQIADGALYYTDSAYDENGNRTVSIRRIDLETGENACIGDPLPAGTDFEYDANYFYLTRHTSRYGYGDLAVRGDTIYFIGDDETPGATRTECIDWNDAAGHTGYRTEYESCAAVYRMDLNGENREMLIPHLGNGANVHMIVTEDQIIVSTCWQSAVSDEAFVNFIRYDLTGAPLEMIANPSPDRHSRVYREDQEFTCTVDALLTNGDAIYASIAAAGGESAASYLADVNDMDTALAYEAYYTPSALWGDTIIYLTSDVQNTQWEDRIPYTLRLMARDARGDRCIAYIPAEYAAYGMQISALGDWAYLNMNGTLLRVRLSGDMPQLLTENGFADAEAFAPAQYAAAEYPDPDAEPETEEMIPYLLPGSDTRLYTEDELSIYDHDLLKRMRDEIPARHGYVFPDPADSAYFEQSGWYQPDPDFSLDELTDIERANMKTIDAMLQ